MRFLIIGFFFLTVYLTTSISSSNTVNNEIHPIKGDTLVYREETETQDVDGLGDYEVFDEDTKEKVKVKKFIKHPLEKVVEEDKGLKYGFPLKMGLAWEEDDNNKTKPCSRKDNMYCYHVKSKEDVVVLAGTFKNCFKIVNATLPDTSIDWYCPGVGIVKSDYRHHGTVTNIKSELEKIVPEKDSNNKVIDNDNNEKNLHDVIQYKGAKLSQAEIELATGLALLDDNNHWEKAEKQFKKAVELDPNLYEAWFNLGLIHIDSQEGMDYFQKVIKINPDYVQAYYWTAYYYTRYGRFKEALPVWENYLKIAKAQITKGDKTEETRVPVADEVVKEIASGKSGKELNMIHIH